MAFQVLRGSGKSPRKANIVCIENSDVASAGLLDRQVDLAQAVIVGGFVVVDLQLRPVEEIKRLSARLARIWLVASVEPSSTTTISKSIPVWSSTLRTACSKKASPLNTVIRTEIVGGY